MPRNHLSTLPKPVILGFFILGIISATSFRIIVVLQHFSQTWARVAWYAGVIGYVFFFLYRFLIAQKRKHIISEHDLISRLEQGDKLAGQDREAALYLLRSLQRSRENFNYGYIFAFSVVAIAGDIILTLTM